MGLGGLASAFRLGGKASRIRRPWDTACPCGSCSVEEAGPLQSGPPWEPEVGRARAGVGAMVPFPFYGGKRSSDTNKEVLVAIRGTKPNAQPG